MGSMHEAWGYCWKWDLLGAALSAAALAAPVFLGVALARLPRRMWAGVLLGGCVAIGGLLAAQVVTLVLWNGVRPAICNRLP